MSEESISKQSAPGGKIPAPIKTKGKPKAKAKKEQTEVDSDPEELATPLAPTKSKSKSIAKHEQLQDESGMVQEQKSKRKRNSEHPGEVELILPRVAGLYRTPGQKYANFPSVHINEISKAAYIWVWIHGYKSKCPEYISDPEGHTPDVEELIPSNKALWWPLGPRKQNPAGEQEVWMARSHESWDQTVLVAFGVGTQARDNQTYGKPFGRLNVSTDDVNLSPDEINQRMLSFTAAGKLIGNTIDNAMDERRRRWQKANKILSQEQALVAEAGQHGIDLEEAILWNGIRRQLKCAFSAHDFQDTQVLDLVQAYKFWREECPADSFLTPTFVLGNWGLWRAHENADMAELNRESPLPVYDFFCYKWMTSSKKDRYQGGSLVHAENAPFDHKPFMNEDLSVDKLVAMKTARSVPGGIQFRVSQEGAFKRPETDHIFVQQQGGDWLLNGTPICLTGPYSQAGIHRSLGLPKNIEGGSAESNPLVSQEVSVASSDVEEMDENPAKRVKKMNAKTKKAS